MNAVLLINQAADLIISPFFQLPSMGGMILLSALSAGGLLFVFKKTSNQEKIKFHKNKIFGTFLEIALYRDQFRRTVLCQLNVLKHNGLYLRYFFVPILIVIIPVILICVQIDHQIGTQPLEPGKEFVVQAKLDRRVSTDILTDLDNMILSVSENLVVETPALRSASDGSVFWRARLMEPSMESFIMVSIEGTDDRVTKTVATTPGSVKFSIEKRKINSLQDVLYSAESPITEPSLLRSVSIGYDRASYPFLFWTVSPVVYYFILTLIFGFIMKPVFKVNI